MLAKVMGVAMSARRCPKCIIHERLYNAPLGKVVRNPYANIANAVHDDCDACNGTGYIPMIIIEAIENFASTSERADEYISQLRWSYDHFSFTAHGIYIGIEKDGYMHS
jgi:hypothetical protein